MNCVLLLSLFFISDVQIDATSVYPDSIATIISSEIGGEHIYDCGDVVENGAFLEEQEYARYLELFPNTTAVPGNHDYYDGLSGWLWSIPIIDVHDSGLHIVGFDIGSWNNSAALELLESVLDDDSVFTILFLHFPVYSDNLRNGQAVNRVRLWLMPILERTGVELVIGGHGHAYERHEADNRTYLVIGGGGAPLDQVGSSSTQVVSSSEHHWLEITTLGSSVNCVVHGINGNIIDSFFLDKPVSNEQYSWSELKSSYR